MLPKPPKVHVTFGARNYRQSLPFWSGLSNNGVDSLELAVAAWKRIQGIASRSTVQTEMTPQSSQSGVIPLPKAIDHYFELALYLLVLTGFGTLASTGGLDLPSTVLVGVALAVRGYMLAQRRSFVISE